MYSVRRIERPMAKKKGTIDFGKHFAELEEIVQWFDRGEPDLDSGLEKFARATVLAKALKERLTEAENTIKEIRATALKPEPNEESSDDGL